MIRVSALAVAFALILSSADAGDLEDLFVQLPASCFTKHLIHHRPDSMHILIANLHKNRTAIRQQIPRHGQPIP